MQIFYVLILVIMIIIVFLVIRYLILGRKTVPGLLFSEALRNENSGNFEAAVITYEQALAEVKKFRFQDQDLRKRIIQKIKVLQTAIEYEKDFKRGK